MPSSRKSSQPRDGTLISYISCIGSSVLYCQHQLSSVQFSCSVVSNSVQPCGLLPGSSVHGILQTRVLEWVAMPSSRKSSQPRDQIQVSCTAGRFCTTESQGKPLTHLTPALKIHGRLPVSFQSLPFLPKPVQVESCDEKPHKPSLTLQVSPFHLVSKN